ncbi:MAG: hypothetical protein Kow00133_03330 [Amphiplicatus sp.]
MRIFTADEAKRNFGAMLKVAKDEIVLIRRHGRPLCVVMPYQAFRVYAQIVQTHKRHRVAVTLHSALAKFAAGDDEAGHEILLEANSLMHRLLGERDRWR